MYSLLVLEFYKNNIFKIFVQFLWWPLSISFIYSLRVLYFIFYSNYLFYSSISSHHFDVPYEYISKTEFLKKCISLAAILNIIHFVHFKYPYSLFLLQIYNLLFNTIILIYYITISLKNKILLKKKVFPWRPFWILLNLTTSEFGINYFYFKYVIYSSIPSF